MTNGRVRENVSEGSWRGQVVLDNRDGVKQNVLSTLCRESRQKILDRWFLDRWLSRWQNVLST